MSPRRQRLTLAGVLAVLATAAAAAAGAAAGQASPAGQETNGTSQAIAVINGKEYTRWTSSRLCPQVSGMTRDEGEFILWRITEVGRRVGVPLDGEQCRPNLFIHVTQDPKTYLQVNRGSLFSCGRHPGSLTSPRVIDEFIETPRVVKVWYNSAVQTPDGFLACADRPVMAVQANASHLRANVERSLWSVFVVVDQKRLPKVSIGQFADYVTLVGLAAIYPDVRPEGRATILSLFDAARQAAPAGLTEWDNAFLKAVYGTDQQSKVQLSELTRHMAHIG